MSRKNPRFTRPNNALPAPTGNVWRVRALGIVENQYTINTFWFQDELSPGTGTATVAATLLAGIQAASNLQAKLLAACSIDWNLYQWLIDSPNNPNLNTQATVVSIFAGGPSSHEPTTVATVIARYTNFKGQCGRGHVSIPAVPTVWVTASSVTTFTAYNALAIQMVQQVTNGGHTFTPGLYSKGSKLHQTAGFAPLASVQARTFLGTVRRRKIGRGK